MKGGKMREDGGEVRERERKNNERGGHGEMREVKEAGHEGARGETKERRKR